MPALLTTLLPTLLGILQMTPALASEVENVIGLLKGGVQLDAGVQGQIDAALAAAYQALQAS